MRRISFVYGSITIEADLLDTPTADAIWDAPADRGNRLDLGRRGVLRLRRGASRRADARTQIEPGDIAYWPPGDAIAIGFGRTPASRGDEIRLASDANVWARARGDEKALKPVRSGSRVRLVKAP